MFVVSVLQAASSLAPSDKYHNNPQGGHRHPTTSVSSSGGGEETRNATTKSNSNPASANNNQQFSHNGIPPPLSTSSSGVAKKLQQYDDQLMQSSPYHFYPSNSVGSSSITSSSHHLNHPHQQQQQQQNHLHRQHQHQQPPCLYKSNHSSSGGSGNGIIIDGSNSGGSAIDGSNNKYYYYYNGYYYPTTAPELLVHEEGGAVPEEDPDQIFTITASTQLVDSNSGKQFMMGRVGEEVYPPGSPASVGYRGNNGISSAGLYKSKSSSIPVTTGSPQPHHRGFRETFISSMSPPVQVHSAESSPLHRSASATTANGSDRYSVKGNSSGGVTGSGNNKQENKKWSFGGLFRRNKTKAPVGASSPATSNNNSGVTENGGTSSANNSHCNSPAKVNNNYGSGSPIIIPNRTTYSPARPASSVGFVSKDPNFSFGSGYIENNRPSSIISSSTSKFVNAEVQTRAKGKLSESDISTCDSDFDLALHQHDPPEPAPQENNKGGYKQNFLVRRLSRRKEKAAAKKAASEQATAAASTTAFVGSPKTSASGSSHHQHHNSSNGFISSQQQHGYLDVPQMKRRVGSSPDSLNNSSEQWPTVNSWETTKKPQSQLQALQQQHRLLQNYSSNGSLSVSQEGYNSNNNSSNNQGSKSTRAAAREAVKARAIARRESFLNESSSDDDTDERSQRSSLQGSFSSLNSRNRRQKAFNMQQAQFQQQRHLFPATTQAAGGISCASPSSPMPVPLDYRNSIAGIATSGMSPNMNRRLMMMGAPGSPKWETRVIYQQQDGATAPESSQPVVVRIPRNERMSSDGGGGATTAGNPSQMSQNNGDQSFIMATEMISEDQHVVTAGLKVPFLPVQNQDQQCLIRNGQLMYPDDPVQYANVANGMRGRSCTPYMGYNNGVGDSAAIHHPSPTPPPPPPPRRDFTRATNNPNFYRPVSCSYLDSYANQLQMRQQSPLIHNGNYIYPVIQQHQQYQGQHETGMNGYTSHSAAAIPPVHNSVDAGSGIVRSSPRHFVPTDAAENKNQADVDGTRHPPLIRSPSEPPVISRADYARISSPVKRLISSPMSNGSNGESHLMDGSGKSSPSQNVITSKLGFPVRRLQEASKLTGPQNPVHLRASEFWRKKDTELTGSPSPVGGNNQQKKYLNRIRSADSSPLPVPKMRKSPRGISDESLSSLSENTASPKNCSSPITNTSIKQSHPLKATPIRSQISRTPNPQQLTYGSNNKDKENNNTQHNQLQSAVERLKVRRPSAPDGIKSTSTRSNPPSSSTTTTSKITTGVGDGDNGHNGGSNKSESNSNPIRALIELNNGKTPGKNLEDALNELETMYKSLRLSDEDLLDRAERRDLPTAHQELRDAPLIPIPQAYHRFEHLGSAESLGTGSGSTGTNYTAYSGSTGGEAPQRVRAPPTRRSARADPILDDMSNRKIGKPDGKPLDPRVVVAKTGSYLARAPAFSPCTSPCPPDAAQQQQLAFTLALLGQEEEPNVTLDDVTIRGYKPYKNSDPHLFGVPNLALGPVTAAPATDYLHSKPSESYRPIFGHLKTPDVVNDDIAFRNLRKDLGQEANLTAKDWTPRLFSPNREVSFNYPKVKDGKKFRAIRSLSANITHMLPTTNSSSDSNAALARGSPTANFFQQQHQRYDNSIGKWNSFGDLHIRASTYLQPSWVEQIETETWERKLPKKTVDVENFVSQNPRRRWTNVILESFVNNKTEAKNELKEDGVVDDDVFMDGAEHVKTSGNSSKNNDLDESLQQARPNKDITSAEAYLELLPGQKTRRGSWVMEQSRSYSNITSHHQDKRRKSWSDLPKDIDSLESSSTPAAIMLSGSRKLFNPLPPPKQIRKINLTDQLKSFNNGIATSTQQADKDNHEDYSLLTLSTDKVKSSSVKFREEDELNELMDQLLKDADACGHSIDEYNASSTNVGTVNMKMNGSVLINEEAADKDKSLSTMAPPPKASEATQKKEMKMDGETSSSEQSCEQDLSCTIVGIIPKQQPNVTMDDDDASIDNCIEKGNAFGVPKEQKALSSNPLPILQGRSKNKVATSTSQGVASSIEDLIESTNESLPQVEDGVDIASIGMITNIFSYEKEEATDKDKSTKSPPPPPTTTATDRNNRKVHQVKECSSGGSSSTSPPSSTYSPNIDMDVDDLSSSISRKVLKIDNSNEKGNAVGVPKERKALSSSDPVPILQGRSKNKVATSASQGVASSIEDLIESINESLPELEASIGSGGGSGSIGMITSSSSDVKPNGSSSASGSPASSIPSPSPGSPTPPVLSVSVIEKAEERGMVVGENGGLLSPSSSAFPVAAKRHHLPSREAMATTEESIYENLPAVGMMMMMKQQSETGNDEKVCSSSPYTLAFDEQKSESSNKGTDPYHVEKASKGKIPPLLTPTSVVEESSSSRSTSSRNKPGGGRRALHDSNNDEDNEDEDTQHSSSHQPSSLSSNDSCDVSGGASRSPRGNANLNKNQSGNHQRQKNDNSNANNNNIKDNINEDRVGETSSSLQTSLPSSVPFDSSISSFDTTAFSNNQNNNQTMTPTARRMSSNSDASSTSSTQFRKKSEGSLHSHSNNSNQKSYPHQATRQLNQTQQNHNFLPRREISNSKNGLGEKSDKRNEIRETFIGNKRVTSSSSPSSSAAEETATSIPTQRNPKKEQPVARSRTSSSAFPSTFNQQTNTTQAKKSSTSTTLATPSAAAVVETSASETGNGGISFLRNNFPFFRNSTSRSRSQSVISDVSRSSETGESKKEKDKSYRRKSHLNRAFTDEPVPDNNYTFDATPKSSKPASSHDASSRENSAVEESRANHKPSVKLHPAIPPVLTGNKSDSNNMSPNKSISRNNSYTQNEMIPSPLPTNSHKSSPVVKKDSFSDAEGVSFIKKMLQKESDRDRAAAAAGGSGTRVNSQNGSSATVNSGGSSTAGYNIKKSPSAGNQSYWSKFSSSQSAFLRKLFEKPKVSESPVNLNKTVQKTNSSANCTQSGEIGEKDSLEKENEGEPVLGFSVAQKASFFMKLEHEQRFSKWRKNSVDLGVISSVTDHQTGENSQLGTDDTQGINEARQQSRFLTRPVTPLEGNLTELSSNHSNSISKNVEFGSLPRMWGDKFHSLENKVAQSSENVGSDNNPSSMQTSSFTDYDDKQKYDHVGIQSGRRKFTEISTRNMKPVSPYTVIEPAVKSYSLTRSSRHNGTSDKILESNLGSFPMYHSASAIINTTAAPAPSTSSSGKHSSMKPSMKFHKNLGNSYNSSSSSSFSEAMSRNDSVKFLPVITKKCMSGGVGEPSPTVYENSVGRSSNNDQRRGSASDLELSGAANNSPLMSRSEKVKSMFISRNRYHGDTDNLSEDGEVSSGGQEVAEIICRSYENSPVFRKKNWRAQKQVQSNFTKEIWRRCGNYESWSHRPQPQQQRQQPQHPVPQTFTATTNVIEVTTIPPTLPSVAASPPPSTSNLLQILTVLSSSNDELNEPKLKSKKHRQGSRDKLSGSSSRSDSIPPMHPNHTVVQPRVSTANGFIHNSVKNPGPISTNNHRHTMPPTPTDNSDVIYVSVPHPEDEAFQSFFCSVKSYTNVSHFPPTNGVIVASLTSNNSPNQQHNLEKFPSAAMVGGEEEGIQTEAGLVDETLDISSVRRESGLLVMKKNVPTCKRKSASKYKNPLRTLAARMDFRQQGYTQTHSTNSNSVQCSSDVDVST